ncbi:MAG: hypothetical protein GAK28_04795 [Luteibacter sp.]|uniref:hypothetical protein n=1 Tax=Luteibacter sp. TaxID=1886636 RepID=UPI00137DCC8B|nr:hypothetical protein [Luteibacter sp.]KAF1003290.1 MAG: hypothetical protein GAK28_04795 [Luteibacter sp.]
MLTKADFQQRALASINKYPTIALRYQAGDPQVIQHIDAMATMLAMYSAQLETAQAEPFEKTRDSTVLADAAMRGIIRKGSSGRVRILAKNGNATAFQVETGRTIIDSSGLAYRAETAANVPAGGTATFEAVQVYTTTITHTVAGSEAFYAIPIPAADDDAYLCGIAVSDTNGEYLYRNRYVNTAVGERVFHVEVDDRQQTYVRFGVDGIVGVQPMDGTAITVEVSYTAGVISPAYGSPFAFEYIGSPAEASVDLKMDALLQAGENPMGMSVLRDLARYPSIYDDNAVFLGEFDYLVRRQFPSLQFLSVWNESMEEQVRGASEDNINAIFVACVSSGGGEAIADEEDPDHPVAPTKIVEEDLTATQRAIRTAIQAADDSYRVYFYSTVRQKIPMAVSAKVSTAYVASDVQGKIEEASLSEFGKDAPASKRGLNQPLYTRVYELLKEKVPELNSEKADLTVTIGEPSADGVRPELWRYVDTTSLTVTVKTVSTVATSWGG